MEQEIALVDLQFGEVRLAGCPQPVLHPTARESLEIGKSFYFVVLYHPYIVVCVCWNKDVSKFV